MKDYRDARCWKHSSRGRENCASCQVRRLVECESQLAAEVAKAEESEFQRVRADKAGAERDQLRKLARMVVKHRYTEREGHPLIWRELHMHMVPTGMLDALAAALENQPT